MNEIVEKLTNMYYKEIIELKNLLQTTTTLKKSESFRVQDCLFIYLLVRYFKPNYILEISSCAGATLLSIILASEKNAIPYHIDTIDNENNILIDKQLLESVMFYKGKPEDILKDFNARYDFIITNDTLNVDAAKLLDNLVRKETVFASVNFVPPYYSGIEATVNIIRYTKLKSNRLVIPSYKCNWIYKDKSFKNIKDKFSSNQILNNIFDLNDAHNKIGVNSSISFISHNALFEKLKVNKTLYKEGFKFLYNPNSQVSSNINFIIFDEKKHSNSSCVIIDNILYVFFNNNIYVNEIVNKIPKIKFVYKNK